MKKILFLLVFLSLPILACDKLTSGNSYHGLDTLAVRVATGFELNREGHGLLMGFDSLLIRRINLQTKRVDLVRDDLNMLYQGIETLNDHQNSAYSVDSLQAIEMDYIFKELHRLEDLINQLYLEKQKAGLGE